MLKNIVFNVKILFVCSLLCGSIFTLVFATTVYCVTALLFIV